MEFHQLRYFVAAAESLNVTRAAEQVHVSQPALSRQLRLLEEELGAELFHRVRKRIHLSDAGKTFLPRARRILAESAEATALVRRKFSAGSLLRLGAITPFLDDLVAPAVHEFSLHHPNIEVQVVDGPPAGLLAKLHKNELDMAILGNLEPAESKRFTSCVLYEHRHAAVLPAHHPLAGRRQIRLADLAADSWVSLADQQFPGRRKFMHSVCRKAGFKPRIVSEVDSIPMLLAAVRSKQAAAILPAHCAKFSHVGCAFVRLSSPVIKSTLLLVHSPRRTVAGASELTDILRSTAGSIDRNPRGPTQA